MRVSAALQLSALIFGTCLLTACGSGGGAIVTPLSSYPDVSGNWAITATSVNGGVLDISGALTSNAKDVSGQLVILSPCFFPVLGVGAVPQSIGIPVTGTVGTDGNVKLVSASSNSQVITLSGMVSRDGGTLSAGQYSVAGGCADKDTGTTSGFRIPNISGTYTGSATLGSTVPGTAGQPITVSAQVTQASVPIQFAYSLTSSITVAGTPCFASGTSPGQPSSGSAALGGTLFGKHFVVVYTMNDSSQFELSGDVDSTGKVLSTIYVVASGSCKFNFAHGTLNRP